jgi:hypothetical protein
MLRLMIPAADAATGVTDKTDASLTQVSLFFLYCIVFCRPPSVVLCLSFIHEDSRRFLASNERSDEMRGEKKAISRRSFSVPLFATCFNCRNRKKGVVRANHWNSQRANREWSQWMGEDKRWEDVNRNHNHMHICLSHSQTEAAKIISCIVSCVNEERMKVIITERTRRRKGKKR